MNPLIKQFIAVAVLLSASTAFSQTVITGTLDANSPLQNQVNGYLSSPNRCIGATTGIGISYQYGAHTVLHTGGTLDVSLVVSESYGVNLAVFDEGFDPSPSPFSCTYALASSDGESSANLIHELPAGTYILVANASASQVSKPYTVTYRSSESVASVPVADISTLALTSLGLIGAAGFVSRRRKSAAEKAWPL